MLIDVLSLFGCGAKNVKFTILTVFKCSGKYMLFTLCNGFLELSLLATLKLNIPPTLIPPALQPLVSTFLPSVCRILITLDI